MEENNVKRRKKEKEDSRELSQCRLSQNRKEGK